MDTQNLVTIGSIIGGVAGGLAILTAVFLFGRRLGRLEETLKGIDWIGFAEMKIQTKILYELFIVRRQESSIEELRQMIRGLQSESEDEDDESE